MTKKDLHSEICRLVKRLSYLETIVVGRWEVTDGSVTTYEAKEIRREGTCPNCGKKFPVRYKIQGEHMTTGITTTAPQPCKCCWGEGVQKNKRTGLAIICPCCGGTGVWAPRLSWPRPFEDYNDDECDDEM